MERAFDVVEHLSDVIGTRYAGTPGEFEAAEYLRDTLASYGYEAFIQEFPIEGTSQLDTEFEVQVAGAPEFATVAMSGSPVGTAEGEIVTAGIGRPSEFPADAAGKIALIERGELTFAEKVLNAQSAGATGVIVYNNEEGPFIGRLDEQVAIPAVSMPRDDGRELAGLIEGSDPPPTASLAVEAESTGAESWNVVAEPPGGECRIVAGGHFDSVANGPGANDNGSGTAVVVEMARAMAADGAFDDVCFVLFGAEEIGLLGSDYYASNLSEEERSRIIAMLNFDMLGIGDEWPLVGDGEVLEIAADQAEALGVEYRLAGMPQNIGSDHANFVGQGIPAVFFNCFCDPRYHTSQDVAEFVDPQRLKEAGEMGMGTIDVLLGGG